MSLTNNNFSTAGRIAERKAEPACYSCEVTEMISAGARKLCPRHEAEAEMQRQASTHCERGDGRAETEGEVDARIMRG